ncbi:hypothetical protein K491DRAFT_673586 [Lophiostoma macrostomum CBS 122681]|uniref:Uncharacterized protein n=1 Tax=Lophiostoma macrostomum CBS 122681 TaxID=1314788 RepID=A0A6A6TRL3_9PLEO|nr:hypothetical protein K491DRAFT_673586 [Lophiostoma macrostomum CBS 122681]
MTDARLLAAILRAAASRLLISVHGMVLAFTIPDQFFFWGVRVTQDAPINPHTPAFYTTRLSALTRLELHLHRAWSGGGTDTSGYLAGCQTVLTRRVLRFSFPWTKNITKVVMSGEVRDRTVN